MIDYLRRCWRGPGGIGVLLPVAIPMILSNVFDTLMMFTDRLFLSYVGKEHMAACMNGGLTAWTCMILFVGTVSYVSAMVARHYGAGRLKACPRVVYQGLFLAVLCYPLVLLLGWFVVKSFTLARHDPLQITLETQYFWICLIGGGFLALIRAPLAAFFSGLGRTRVIMAANALALLVNLFFNYALIFGKFGFPRWGIAGAAAGSVLASATMDGVLFACFWHSSRRPEFWSAGAWRPSWAVLVGVLRFGLPNGLESLLGTMAFNAVIIMFHGFGADAAAAITVVLNWDLFSFFPLLGMQIGITTIVGQCLGAGNPAEAERAAYNGFGVCVVYALLVLLCFLTLPRMLVRPFTSVASGIDYTAVIELAVPMMRVAAFYILFDCIYLSFAGALRGGGDTLAAMLIGCVFHAFLAANAFTTVYILQLDLLSCWMAWVFSIMFGGLGIYARFRTRKWQHIALTRDEIVVPAVV